LNLIIRERQERERREKERLENEARIREQLQTQLQNAQNEAGMDNETTLR
jgi:hypothetical protein